MTMKRTYVVLTYDVRLSSVNTLNQKTTIEKIIKQNSTLHKSLNILRVAWTKKVINQRKKNFFSDYRDRQFENDESLNKRKLVERTHAFNLRILRERMLYKIMFQMSAIRSCVQDMQKFAKMRTMRSKTFNKRLSNRDQLSIMR
jgi:hypothetical protein